MKIGKKFSKKFDNGGMAKEKGSTSGTGHRSENRMSEEDILGMKDFYNSLKISESGGVPLKEQGIPTEEKAMEDFNIFIDTMKPGDTIPEGIADILAKGALQGGIAASKASVPYPMSKATFKKKDSPEPGSTEPQTSGDFSGAALIAIMNHLQDMGWTIDENGVVKEMEGDSAQPQMTPTPRNTTDFGQ